MLGTPLTSPNYTLFCKRAKEAKNSLPRLSHAQPMEIAIDSSGLKVTGEGEWKVKKHGVGKRRGWIKIHIGVDTHTQELTTIEVTDEKTADSNVLPNLVEHSAKSLQKVLAVIDKT